MAYIIYVPRLQAYYMGKSMIGGTQYAGKLFAREYDSREEAEAVVSEYKIKGAELIKLEDQS